MASDMAMVKLMAPVHLLGLQQLQIPVLHLGIPVGNADDGVVALDLGPVLHTLQHPGKIGVCHGGNEHQDLSAFSGAQSPAHHVGLIAGGFDDLQNPPLGLGGHVVLIIDHSGYGGYGGFRQKRDILNIHRSTVSSLSNLAFFASAM